MNKILQAAGLALALSSCTASASMTTVNIGGENVILSTPKGYIDCDKANTDIFPFPAQEQLGSILKGV